MASAPDTVDFYFDPICPYAYQTSLWIRDVKRQTGLAITWKFFSLEEINRPEGKKHPWEREISYGWTPMRIAAWLRRKDMDACDAWYRAFIIGTSATALFLTIMRAGRPAFACSISRSTSARKSCHARRRSDEEHETHREEPTEKTQHSVNDTCLLWPPDTTAGAPFYS